MEGRNLVAPDKALAKSGVAPERAPDFAKRLHPGYAASKALAVIASQRVARTRAR
jgi:hypothetical protein